jgi:hypothetical protein
MDYVIVLTLVILIVIYGKKGLDSIDKIGRK